MGTEEASTPFPGVKVARQFFLFSADLAILQLRLDSAFVDIMSRDPEELAQQLLLIDLEMFQAIPVNEFLLGNVRHCVVLALGTFLTLRIDL